MMDNYCLLQNFQTCLKKTYRLWPCMVHVCVIIYLWVAIQYKHGHALSSDKARTSWYTIMLIITVGRMFI